MKRSFLTMIGCLILFGVVAQDSLANIQRDTSAKPNTEQLAEVEIVSTGYERLTRERSAGSFDVLNKTVINRRVSSDILSRISDVSSGVIFNKTRGGDQLTIRGVSTIYSNVNPLIIVDNFPYEGDFGNINPNNVATISILKDASAVSIWGARASNGVIVITTKKGASGKTRVELNSNLTLTGKPDPFYLPKMNSTDIIDIEKMLFENGRYDIDLQYFGYRAQSPVVNILKRQRNGDITAEEADALIDQYRSVDNRFDLKDRIYQQSVAQQYSLNISGGTSVVDYFLGAGIDMGNGKFGEENTRITIRMQNNYKVSPKLTARTSLNYVRKLNKGSIYPVSGSRLPYERLINQNGEPSDITYEFSSEFSESARLIGLKDWNFNPLKDAALNNSRQNLQEIRLQAGLEYELLRTLAIEINYQFQQQSSDNTDIKNPESYYVRNLINLYAQREAGTGAIVSRPIPDGGIYIANSVASKAHNGRIQFNYALQKNDHVVNAIAGVEARQVETTGESYAVYGYDERTENGIPVNHQNYFTLMPTYGYANIPGAPAKQPAGLDRFRSGFLNGSYTFRNRYTFSGSARKDASNYFGVKTNQRAVPLWSAGVRWNIANETFFKSTWLQSLGVRGTIGTSGNLNKSLTAFTTMRYMGANATGQQYAHIINPPNPNLRWETTSMINFGVDFSLIKNLLSGSFEYYLKRSKDLFGSADIDGTTGILDGSSAARFQGNVGSMKGSGLDFKMRSQNIDRAFKWSTYYLFSIVSDHVTQYDFKLTTNDILTAAISPVVGKPVSSIYAFAWGGLDPNTGAPRGMVNKQPSADYTAILQAKPEDLVFVGAATPRRFGSIRNDFFYKGIGLSINITYRGKYYLRRPTLDYGSLFQSLTSHSDFYNRWQQPGDELRTNVPSMQYPANSQATSLYAFSSILAEPADHIRLQDIRLSVDLVPILIRRGLIQNFQVYTYANNIGLLWRQTSHDIDPDFPISPPDPRSFSLGITVNF